MNFYILSEQLLSIFLPLWHVFTFNCIVFLILFSISTLKQFLLIRKLASDLLTVDDYHPLVG